MSLTSIRSSSSLKKQTQKRQRERGKEYAREWRRNAHLATIREALFYIELCRPNRREPWKYLRETLPALKQKLETEGAEFTLSFFDELATGFQAELRIMVNVRHNQGVLNGERWAADFSSPEQIERLRAALTNPGYLAFFVTRASLNVGTWTPAHELVVIITGDSYPVDAETGEEAIDSEKFKDFWRPFVSEPIENVLADLDDPSIEETFKLMNRDYVMGFVDGALGLSDEMRLRLGVATTSMQT